MKFDNVTMKHINTKTLNEKSKLGSIEERATSLRGKYIQQAIENENPLFNKLKNEYKRNIDAINKPGAAETFLTGFIT